MQKILLLTPTSALSNAVLSILFLIPPVTRIHFDLFYGQEALRNVAPYILIFLMTHMKKIRFTTHRSLSFDCMYIRIKKVTVISVCSFAGPVSVVVAFQEGVGSHYASR
jgi:hypothetical protein